MKNIIGKEKLQQGYSDTAVDKLKVHRHRCQKNSRKYRCR